VASDLDAVVVGGGHNGLVAAAYLARAGRRVRVLERLEQVGGAAVSAQVFDGVEARLSRYSYLVSLLPQRLLDELGVRVQLAPRRYSSYTPDPSTGGCTGLLIGPGAPAAKGFTDFYRRCGTVTQRLWPTLLEPLRSRDEARRHVGGGRLAGAAWDAMVNAPIGHAITEAVRGDLVRGIIATDALIGTFARTDDATLRQNVCFLYHLMGGGTGRWDVPVGGMGAVSGALAAAAAQHGADIITRAEVQSIDPDGEVSYCVQGQQHRVHARFVLAGVTPGVLAGLLGEPAPELAPGAQVKVNMVLRRLPMLRDDNVSAQQAFGGTFHVNEMFSQLDAGHAAASAGQLPDPLPCEIYCHSLTDPSILSERLRAVGAHTLTVFGLHTPHQLVAGADPDAARSKLTGAVLASLNTVLAEPVQDVLMTDSAGRECIETKTTRDLETALNMTAGNIFHGDLRWPFAENDEQLQTPAQRWGVATAHDRIMLCGSGARRGGAVSGIGGHNAAMAVLETKMLD
jgi:phytoene dehydrogenase-like protein